jgi:hypothetical protein
MLVEIELIKGSITFDYENFGLNPKDLHSE